MTEIYTLNTGAPGAETSRLDFQHHFFLKMSSTLLPSQISESLRTTTEPLKVADVACGTAIWLKALATELPQSTELHGFDIYPANFPPLSTLPDNVQLHAQSTLDPFLEEFHGKFDLVHVRLLMYSLKKDEWITAIKNLTTILKPGGWLFWEESGYTSWVTLPPSKAFYKWVERELEYAKKVGRDLRYEWLTVRIPEKKITHILVT
jgi:SAM-dependent methyltransferase